MTAKKKQTRKSAARKSVKKTTDEALHGTAFNDWLYQEVLESREFFFEYTKQTSVFAATVMRQRAIDVVKNLSHEDGPGMGSARLEEAIRSLRIPNE